MNHPALVKTIDQPSFSCDNFSPFTSDEALWSSDISAVPSVNLKPNHRGGTAKKITSSPYKKFVEATQKRKIKQATKSKTGWPASNALLGLSKRRKRRVCRGPTMSDTPWHSDTDLAVPFSDDSTEGDKEQDADCVFCTGRFSKEIGYDVRNVSDGRTHFVLVWRKILFVSLVRDKHCIVLILYPLYLYFFLYFVTIPCAFCENYSPPQIRNTCAPNLGTRSF